MNFLISFSEFYSGLSSDGMFFFWIIIFLFCFLLFLTIILIFKNKKLVLLLKEGNSINSNEVNNEEIPIVDKSFVIEEDKKEVFENKKENNIKIDETIDNEQDKIEKEETVLYKKNVLREMSSRTQTSPISISSSDVVYKKNDINDFDEPYLREEYNSPLEEMEDTYEVNDNMKFASEIVKKMEEEIKPSNIELTDYEKKQEEDAIISYDELLKVKDKIYNITDDEETDEFIDELKSFRLDL